MARTREVILDQDEDIVYYEHHLVGKFVRVAVGFGAAMPDGSFVAAESQNYEQFTIQDKAYDDLMAATDTKPAGVFRREDLWRYVDIGRAAAIAEREQMILAKEEQVAAAQTPQPSIAAQKNVKP